MKTHEIEILLQKFYDGMTSPEEEVILEQYFLKGPSDPGLEADEKYFREIRDSRLENIEVPDDLEQLVLARLESVQNQPVEKSNRLMYIIMSSAATVLLVVSSVLFLSRKDATGETMDTQLAYAQSLEALETVSAYLNQGTVGLSGLNKLNQGIEPLKNLHSIERATRELSLLSKLGNALNTTKEFAQDK